MKGFLFPSADSCSHVSFAGNDAGMSPNPSAACGCGRNVELVEKKCILLIDDSASKRQLIAFVLRNAGYEVIFADNCSKAGDMMKSFRIDMIIADMEICGDDAVSFVRRFRSIAEHLGTPVVFMASKTGKANKKPGCEAGVNGWIRKPFTAEVLMRTVRKFLA